MVETTGGQYEGDDRLNQVLLATDERTGRLDIQGFLEDLLELVREILKVDTAAVLLLDPSGNYLVATAARGLEEEVYQGFRLPVGSGFAGRVGSERRPVTIEEVTRATVRNPVLHQKGVRSLLGVPMLVGTEFIGIVHVGTLSPRRFSDEDIAMMQWVADRAAVVTRARVSEGERIAAGVLQRSLLPARLPDVGGLEFAARYVPAGIGGIGGDWYDVFLLPSGSLGIVIGDVVGHNLRAAVVMGRLRSALRAYALDNHDPAEVLAKLDRKVHHFEPDMMATVLYAMVEPSGRRMYVSLAGHLPPVLVVPGESAQLLDLPVDPPVGVRAGLPRTATPVDLPPGWVAFFYTDGLVERGTEDIDEGLGRLVKAVVHGSCEDVCADVMAKLVGSAPASDDIAVLAACAAVAPGD